MLNAPVAILVRAAAEIVVRCPSTSNDSVSAHLITELMQHWTITSNAFGLRDFRVFIRRRITEGRAAAFSTGRGTTAIA